MKLPISVLIMTFNEELNIVRCIKSVIDNFSQVIVVDSFSSDNTKNIIQDFANVKLYENKFTHWADQRNWMLENCHIDNEWVFFLDADESITQDFFEELWQKFSSKNPDITSFFVNKDLYFLGKNIRRAYSHPKIRLIFCRVGLTYHAEGAREYATIEGESGEIHTPLIHEDLRPFNHWVTKHLKNAEREKNLFLAPKENSAESISLPVLLRLRKAIRVQIYNKLPLVLRPLVNFSYRYFIKLGILDGVPGLLYCFNQALWYEYVIVIKILEEKRRLNNE